MAGDDEEASSSNKLLFEALRDTLSKMLDEKLEVFRQERASTENEQVYENPRAANDLQEGLDVPNGPLTRAKARRLQQAISTMLNQAESNLSTMIAYPTTLVVIQAG